MISVGDYCRRINHVNCLIQSYLQNMCLLLQFGGSAGRKPPPLLVRPICTIRFNILKILGSVYRVNSCVLFVYENK